MLTDRELLARAAAGVLDEQEQDALASGPPGRWSRADLPLLDEAEHLIERASGYAHVVLDEAQDLSEMQLRAVGRTALPDRKRHGAASFRSDDAFTCRPYGEWYRCHRQAM